jgi:alanine racemase
VWSVERARAIAATRSGRTVRLHLKVDTGMTRLGVDLPDVASAAAALRDVEGVTLDGLYSHFATADAVETAPAQAQIARFREAIASLGASVPHIHLANSAAVMSQPPAHFTLVRPGLMLYGCAPAPHLAERAALRPALRRPAEPSATGART